MNAHSSRELLHGINPHLPADVQTMACSIAHEFSERFPFAIARVRIALFGTLARPEFHATLGQALMLGLSGVSGDAADQIQTARVFALHERMMAIRLAGLKLVAFHPSRDMQLRPERLGMWENRIRASAWTSGGQLVGLTERIAIGMAQCDSDFATENPRSCRLTSA